MPPADAHVVCPVEMFLARLHEPHEVCVYDAIERLVQAGDAVGLNAHTLLRMLERGKTLQELIELIELRSQGRLRAA